MKRRDLIIIAVLVNAGLLIVLFASALKSNDATQELAAATAPEITKSVELPIKPKAAGNPKEEVDAALSHYSSTAKSAESATPHVQSTLPALASSPTPSLENSAAPSFADDLQALTMPQGTPSPLASTPAPAGESVRAELIEVKVKKGDVLEKIAKVNHSSVEEIMKLNQLTSTRLKVGQVLKVKSGGKKESPVKASAQTAKAGAQTVAEKSDGAVRYYTVKNGDNPWTIAVKNRMKLEDLLKLNNLTEEKARRLKPGDQLRIH
jgi:peptidoglycan DL-endopeptidase LytF